ncbi:MAG: efflux RND transporter periplasmic adaptor subunit [Ahrensia sp.]|nr:efflux RND transporter periplasmic adaptor subunit [Ahrensia sp.]
MKPEIMKNGIVATLATIALASVSIPANASDEAVRTGSLASSEIPVRGVIRAIDEAIVSTNIAVPVKEIRGRPGDSFQIGDPLVIFDCGQLEAAHQSTRIERDIAIAQHKNNQLLQKRGAIARHDVAMSQLAVGKATADLQSSAEQLKQCVIEAPFSGSFAEINVKRLQTPTQGTSILRLVSNETLEVEMIVPSSWLIWLDVGSSFNMHVDELDRSFGGTVDRLGANIDAVSQTLTVYGRIDVSNGKILPGMSGLVEVTRGTR